MSDLDSPDSASDPPVEQLATFEEPASDRLLDHVLETIDARQTSDSALEMGWWGLTGWLNEMLSFLTHALGLERSGGNAGR